MIINKQVFFSDYLVAKHNKKGKEMISKKLFNLRISSAKFNIIYCLFTILVFNIPFMQMMHKEHNSVIFTIFATIVVFVALYVVINLLFVKKVTKPLSILLLFFSTSSLYFMINYKIVVDKIMLLNVLQTDIYESTALLTWKSVFFLFAFFIVPAFLIIKTQIIYGDFKAELKNRVIYITTSLLACGLILLINLDLSHSSLRRFKYYKNSIVPINYIGAVISVCKIKMKYRGYEVKKISEDAHMLPQKEGAKPNLIAVVIGESARRANFSLYGYNKPTNEPLEGIKDELLLFDNVTACGTSTAIALPCIFSPFDRKSFKIDSSKYNENVLDILSAAGYKVIWRENNTDCKDNCNRIEIEMFCQAKECYDDVLLTNFAQKVKSTNKPTVVVFHQRGSHGPLYKERYPDGFEKFSPVCDTAVLGNCNLEHLENGYDNSLVYTSQVLKNTIDELKNLSNEYNTAFLFTSDHGQSLGEDGIYLHSAYYDTAPKGQIEIPMFFWFSDGYIKDNNLDVECLKSKKQDAFSHDNVFHTLIGMGSVASSYYNPDLDMLASCRKK